MLFTPDGNSLLSPVGNRVTVFDLVKYVDAIFIQFLIRDFTTISHSLRASLPRLCSNSSHTLPFENRTNIKHMALSPNGSLLITVDDGAALLLNQACSPFHFC